jgi:hypothetical protein
MRETGLFLGEGATEEGLLDQLPEVLLSFQQKEGRLLLLQLHHRGEVPAKETG